MPFHVRDPETDTLVRQFARQRDIGLTEAVKLAVTEALDRREAERERMSAAIREVQAEFAKLPKSGLEADKAFYDSLNDE